MARRHVEYASVSVPIAGHVHNLSDCETDFGGWYHEVWIIGDQESPG